MEKCKYCQSIKPHLIFTNPDITVEGTELVVRYDAYSVDSSFNEWININYCPMCGHKLGLSNEEEIRQQAEGEV